MIAELNNTDNFENISRSDKEKILKQKGVVIWFTGLSASGKTTLATALENRLHSEGLLTQVLDGDIIRQGLCRNLGFSDFERTENIRRIAEVAKLFCQSGVVTLVAFISPTNAIRQIAKQIIGNDDFFEVYVSTPLEICESRDPKGLYKKARVGEIKEFTGISSPYEPPVSAWLSIDTTKLTVNKSANELYNQIISRITGMKPNGKL
jgi:adenylylsulfate kinase